MTDSSLPAGRRTSIIATLGPVSESRAVIQELVAAGMDVVRLSMSNGTRERHLSTVRLAREAAREQGRAVRFLADLQGRKNRIGRLPGGTEQWDAGDRVVLTRGPGDLAQRRTWMTFPWDPDTTPVGTAVLIDDGAVTLEVVEVGRDELRCDVVEGGVLTNGRGLTIPGVTVFPPGLSERDADDLKFAVGLGVETVALSFACRPGDAEAVRALAAAQAVVGKVENQAAAERLPQLAAEFDGLMVARGDLAVELPFEEVPFVQRAVLDQCRYAGKTSIVATQLLHSMRTALRPTRAEVADVVAAVLGGADALMLTGETGYGSHPVHAVRVLRRIIERAEQEKRDEGAGW
ncbi:pyruvate kinase [Catenulispora sp. EB89]|uniref:pyruvate kinase n=1 Tax=Catenulispora sp. EB89 TaxID=3156257 RepID=UPI0035187AB0